MGGGYMGGYIPHGMGGMAGYGAMNMMGMGMGMGGMPPNNNPLVLQQELENQKLQVSSTIIIPVV